jgi:hypothetical protein
MRGERNKKREVVCLKLPPKKTMKNTTQDENYKYNLEAQDQEETKYIELVSTLKQAKEVPFELSNEQIREALKEGLGEYYEEIKGQIK